MEILYNLLYRTFAKELMNLNIGYNFNKDSLFLINELVNAIDCIEHNNLTNEEIIKLIQYYDTY